MQWRATITPKRKSEVAKSDIATIMLAGVLCSLIASAVDGARYAYGELHQLGLVTRGGASVILYGHAVVGKNTPRVTSGDPSSVYLAAKMEPPQAAVVTKDPNLEWYPLGTPVMLTATPVGFEPLCAFDECTSKALVAYQVRADKGAVAQAYD